MKKLFVLLLMIALLIGVSAPHVHNDSCGYDPKTKMGCIYEEDIDYFQNEGPYI